MTVAATTPIELVDGVKEFHIVAEELTWEFAPGMVVKCWGYNGRTPGPTIVIIQASTGAALPICIQVISRLPWRIASNASGIVYSAPAGYSRASLPGITCGRRSAKCFIARPAGCGAGGKSEAKRITTFFGASCAAAR